MEYKHFELLNGEEAIIFPATAEIINRCGDVERAPCLFVMWRTGEEIMDAVVFGGWCMDYLNNGCDVYEMAEDSSAWDTDCETLETVRAGTLDWRGIRDALYEWRTQTK